VARDITIYPSLLQELSMAENKTSIAACILRFPCETPLSSSL
jgi:hypothetical protein